MRILATYPAVSAARARPLPARAPRAISAQREQGRGIVDFLFGLGIAALFGLSAYALEYFGVPYVTGGGTLLHKVHPSSYIFALAVGIAIIANPNPVGYFVGLVARQLGAVALIAACAVAFVFVTRYHPTSSAAYLVDSIIAAALVSLLMIDIPPRAHLTLAKLLHFIIFVNAGLAIIEVASGWRLFPFGIVGEEMVWDYRATAFFGHPLGGALAIGVYAVILMTAREVPGLSARLRLPMILLCMASMPAIGARTSFVIVYAVAAFMVGLWALAFLRGKAVNPFTLLAGIAAIPLAVTGIAVVFQLGFLDGFLGRFENDFGSASARVNLYNLFSHYGWQEMVTGYDPAILSTRIRMEGVTDGIENTWVGHLMQFGIPISVMLWCALAAFLVQVGGAAGRYSIVPIFFMLAVLSTTVGISGKANMLAMPIVIMLVLLAYPTVSRSTRTAAGPEPRQPSQFRPRS